MSEKRKKRKNDTREKRYDDISDIQRKFNFFDGSAEVINGWKGIYTEFGWYIVGREDVVNKIVKEAENDCVKNDTNIHRKLHYLNLNFPTCAKKALTLQ